MKKLISLILVAVSLLTLFSCSSDIKMPKAENNETVLTVGGKKINYDVFRYFFLNSKLSIDNGDEEYWTNNPDAEKALKDEVLDLILTAEATVKLASKHKIKLTKSEKQEVNDQLSEWRDMGFDGYMTDHAFVYVQRYVSIWQKIYNYAINEESGVIKCTDATVLADIPVNFKNIRYIMLEFDDTNKDEKKTLADSLLAQARDGGDFERFVKDYCEDPYMRSLAGSGYYFTKGQIAEDVETIADTLEIGEFSEVVTVDGAYFIVQRIEIDDDYVQNNLNKFIEMYLARRFNEMVEEIKDGLTVKYTDTWENANVSNVK